MPANQTIAPPERLTIAAAVDRGYGGYSTLRRRIATGELPAEQVGRRYLIRASDLEALATPIVGRPSESDVLKAAVDRVVAAAPRLSPEQRRELASLLAGGAS